MAVKDRDIRTGRFTDGNKAALKHGAYSMQSFESAKKPSIRGVRALTRYLDRLKSELESITPQLDVKKQLLINQVISLEEKRQLIDMWLKSIYGLPLDRQEKRIFRECTRLKRYKPKVYRESTIICGRRGGKSNQIAVYPCSEVAARGTSTVCAVLDELAFFKHEGVSVDREIVNSIKPSLIQFFESKILKVSNPGKKSGIVYQDYKEHFAKDSEVLVFQAPSHRRSVLRELGSRSVPSWRNLL
jgi:hypothetical protein